MKRLEERTAARDARDSRIRSPHGDTSRFVAAAAWSGAGLFAASLAWFAYSYFVRFGVTAGPGPMLRPVALDVLLFSAFALHHSLLARTRVKTRLRRVLPAPIERSLYTWVASLLFIGVCALWQPVPGLLYRLEGLPALAGYGVQIAGVLVTIRGAGAVDVLELAGVRPMLLARRGRPPDRVRLETRGVYGLVRHPLYLAWTLVVFGAPAMTATRFVFAVVSTSYLAIAIPFEERGLHETFGADYARYRERVRWRMLPYLY